MKNNAKIISKKVREKFSSRYICKNKCACVPNIAAVRNYVVRQKPFVGTYIHVG